jgi:hypothetical protein
MSEQPTATPAADLNLGVTFPFEALAIEIIKAWSAGRANMKDTIRDRWDVIGIEAAEYAWGQAKKLLPK